MSIAYASRGGTALERLWQVPALPDLRSKRFTLHKGKVASVLLVSILMLGILGNAMLLQTGHMPASAQALEHEPETAPVVAALASPPAEATPIPAADPIVDGTVDTTAVGSIPAAKPKHAKPRAKPIAARAPKPRVDAIAAFLGGSHAD